jgi:O-antigen/teichoic acid export membrane protein
MNRQILRNFSFGFGAQLLVKLMSFTFSIFVVRTLGATAFGQYSTINAYGQLFLFVADLGLATYAIRMIAQTRDQANGRTTLNDFFANLLVLRLMLAVVSAGLAVFAAWLTGRPAIILAAMALNALSLVLYGWQSASEIALSGLERLDVVSKARVLYQFLFVCAGTVALYFGFGYIGLIIGNIGAVLIFTLVCARSARRHGVVFGAVEPARWLPMLRASAPFAVLTLALAFSYKFDTVLIEHFHGSEATGYYNAAYNLIFNAVVFSNVLNTTLFPSLSRQAKSDPSKLPAAYERVLRYLMIVALPVTVGVFMLSDDLIPFLFKQAFLPAAPALKILIWVVPLQYATEFLGYVIVIANRERIVARSVVISSLVAVLANLLVIPRYGFMGAAVMTVVTEAVLLTQYVWLLRGELRELDWMRFLLRPALAALLMGAALLAANQFAPAASATVAPLLTLLMRVFLAGIVYACALLLLRAVGRDELDFVRRLRLS